MSAHQWYYMKSGFAQENVIGPVNEDKFLEEIRQGKITPNTQINSKTRTNDKWLALSDFPGALQVYQQGIDERQKIADDKKAANELAKTERQIAVSQRNSAAYAEDQVRLSEIRAICDSSNTDLAEKIRDGILAILTDTEVIEYIAIQSKPIAIKPDAVVVTNRRMIFYRPKMLGRFDFDDHLWLHLYNAHLAQNMLGSTFSATTMAGQQISMGYLDKAAAAKIYRIAQQREEEAIEVRRSRAMEESAAGATNISVQTPAAPSPVSNDTNSPVERLRQLKEMLDMELITQEEFDERKAEIIAEL
jgi:hypothetical protein